MPSRVHRTAKRQEVFAAPYAGLQAESIIDWRMRHGRAGRKRTKQSCPKVRN